MLTSDTCHFACILVLPREVQITGKRLPWQSLPTFAVGSLRQTRMATEGGNMHVSQAEQDQVCVGSLRS
ncbi:hypothetical protein IF2G_03369 [Cordyceps javanica]|nr:hypothetical protein IF2G_03369 [Cordyceps javanica]